MIRLSQSVRTAVSPDGAVVLDVKHGHMYRANPIGSKILELLKRGFSQARIIGEISLLCNVPAEAIASDVGEFLALIEQQHLVETDGMTSAEQGLQK
jgi:hypothetical protein